MLIASASLAGVKAAQSFRRGGSTVEVKGFFGSLFDLSFNDFITTKIIKVLYQPTRNTRNMEALP